jgi:hypothetical protein
LTAARFNVPETVMKIPVSLVASMRSGAVTTGRPVIAAKCLAAALA